MTFERIVLTDQQTDYLLRHFKNTPNAKLAKKLGISESSLHRLARRYGLKKTKQFQTKCQRNAAAKAKESHLANGTYPPKGFVIPKSAENRFKPGESNRDRNERKYGAKKAERMERARIEKAKATRNETIRKERIRINWGFEQKTNLRLTGGGTKRTSARYSLRKAGYIVERGDNEAFAPQEVRDRHPRLERWAQREGIRIYSDEVCE